MMAEKLEVSISDTHPSLTWDSTQLLLLISICSVDTHTHTRTSPGGHRWVEQPDTSSL